MKAFTVIKFLLEDIEVNDETMTFKLKRIAEINTRVHNLIG
jgi:hypothetical protein